MTVLLRNKEYRITISTFVVILLVCYAIFWPITIRYIAVALHHFISGCEILIFFAVPFSSSQGCDLIEDGVDQYVYKGNTQLRVSRVDSDKGGVYTCTVTFTLDGVTGSMSETIDAWVSGENETEEEKRNLPELRYGFGVSPQMRVRSFPGQKKQPKTDLVCFSPPSRRVHHGPANTRTHRQSSEGGHW